MEINQQQLETFCTLLDSLTSENDNLRNQAEVLNI